MYTIHYDGTYLNAFHFVSHNTDASNVSRNEIHSQWNSFLLEATQKHPWIKPALTFVPCTPMWDVHENENKPIAMLLCTTNQWDLEKLYFKGSLTIAG